MWGSRRRRPITSPPGGGTLARPSRARSGPASRNDARMRLASRSSISCVVSSAAWTRTSFSPVHSASAPRCWRSSTIVSASRIRGTFVSVTGSSVSRHAARIGSTPFLFPAARTRPEIGRPPSVTNDSAATGLTVAVDTEAAILAPTLEPTREQAWETLTRYTKSEALLRHALAVEASTASYARRFGEDEELWRVTALLRDEGYPEEVVEAVLSHAEHLGLPRDTPLKKTLFACDELSGFVHACGLVRPDGIETLEPRSVKKKLKQPSFASGVSREDVYEGAEGLGVELDEHIAFVIEALRPIAPRLGLRTAAA